MKDYETVTEKTKDYKIGMPLARVFMRHIPTGLELWNDPATPFEPGDGIPHQTSGVALYTKSFNGSNSVVRGGNIATDVSLRSDQFVALDTTPEGRLLQELQRRANGSVPDTDGLLTKLLGRPNDLVAAKLDLNRQLASYFDKASHYGHYGDSALNFDRC